MAAWYTWLGHECSARQYSVLGEGCPCRSRTKSYITNQIRELASVQTLSEKKRSQAHQVALALEHVRLPSDQGGPSPSPQTGGSVNKAEKPPVSQEAARSQGPWKNKECGNCEPKETRWCRVQAKKCYSLLRDFQTGLWSLRAQVSWPLRVAPRRPREDLCSCSAPCHPCSLRESLPFAP